MWLQSEELGALPGRVNRTDIHTEREACDKNVEHK